MKSKSTRNHLGLFLAFSIWLLARPYTGIWHDGEIYLIQALKILRPGVYENDLFFFAESQARFSIFPELHAFLIGEIGVENGGKGLMFTAAVFFFLAAIFLGQKILPGEFVYLGMLALACFPHIYGANQTFAFAETFLTARTYAEPFCLLGLGALISRRYFLAGISILIAFCFHPLVALPVILIVMIYLGLKWRKYLYLYGLSIGFVIVLSYLKIAPFSGLFEIIDSGWLTILAGDPTLFLGNWILADWNIVFFDVSVLVVATHLLRGNRKTLVMAVILCTLAALIGTGLLADLFHLLLPTQLQFWRSLWLAHFLAIIILPWLFIKLRRGGKINGALFLILAFITIPYHVSIIASGIGLFLVVQKDNGSAPVIKSRLITLLLGFTILLGGALPMTNSVDYASYNVDMDFPWQISLLFSVPLITFLVSLLIWILLNKFRMGLVAVFLVGIFFISIWRWDARADNFENEIELYSDNASIFPQVSPGQQVFWHDNPKAVWLLIKTPSFFSNRQCAGSVFSKKTTDECVRRGKVLRAYDLMQNVCNEKAVLLKKDVSCLPSARMLFNTCQSLLDLDFVVLQGEVENWSEASWMQKSGLEKRMYYLYACSSVRRMKEPHEN